ILPLIELPGIVLPGKRRFRRAFDLYVDLNLPFADAYHVALMESQGISEIVSYDAHFERIPGLRRVEP
ncbi:MAG: type II toxin-antitoxin system VapC family toxin, partial [Anaerolineae bacterium]|nr:type II toxin-antitoxin system VapC family toxin [Anaerolineae bacterium]